VQAAVNYVNVGAAGSVAKMPKLINIKKPSSTVFMFDCAFNPVTEVVNSSPTFNSVNPANRWRSAASRHNVGANINFLDGHAQYYRINTVTNSGTMSGTAQETAGAPLIWHPLYRDQNP
jgi:prepilin-type processing-associated H-X9-DG protein